MCHTRREKKGFGRWQKVRVMISKLDLKTQKNLGTIGAVTVTLSATYRKKILAVELYIKDKENIIESDAEHCRKNEMNSK